MERITIRFDDSTARALEEYAALYTSGNISQAIRGFIDRGLEYSEGKRGIDVAQEETLEEYLLRMVKVCSRGTKASLASLALLSHLVPSVAMFNNLETNLLLRPEEINIDEYEQLAVDALFDLEQFRQATADSVFNWAWAVGGRLQASKGTSTSSIESPLNKTPNLSASEKNLKPHKYSN